MAEPTRQAMHAHADARAPDATQQYQAQSRKRPPPNPRLAICLPTYNRCELLGDALDRLIAVVEPYGIAIHVSDNHSDDATGAVVASRQQRYVSLHYSRCDTTLPVDQHFQRVLHLPDTEYRWLFGDHYRIVSADALERLLAALDQGFDVVVVNAENRVQNLPTQTFTCKDSVLASLGWHMTMMTSLVYRAEALRRMNFERFYGTNFVQTLSIFEYLDGRPFALRWLSDIVVGGLQAAPRNSWHARTLQIFVRGWFVGIMSLPPGYAYEAKLKALRSHAEHVSLFSMRSLLHLRTLGAIDARLLRSYASELPYVFDRGTILRLWLCAWLPVGLLRATKRIAARLRARLRKQA